ncbi:hypothetical protein ABT025_20340 [Streptomyces sp. NPDC002809]|uniref:hypothetical protein n=1 Tax=Streptomyces sp. NPDC002809 TaxID=3154433 RepID=UPI00332E73B2
MDEVRNLPDEAEQNTIQHQFGRASVDVRRGPDGALDGLSVRTDFESHSADHYRLLAEITRGPTPGIGEGRTVQDTSRALPFLPRTATVIAIGIGIGIGQHW